MLSHTGKPLPHRHAITLFAALALLLGGCGGDDDGGGAGAGTGATGGVSGVAQKGPFQPGGSASAVRLAADGSQTADSVSGSVGTDGRWNLPEPDWNGATLLVLSGTWFDEVSGTFSSTSRELHGVAVIAGGSATANVNLYTHLIAARTRNRMAAGDAFADARSQARTELRTLTGITGNPSQLDLLDAAANPDQADGANLLLFSAAVSKTGLDQAAIDAMAADFADDGQMNGSVDGSGLTAWDQVKQAAANDPGLLDQARSALQSQYGEQPPDGGSGGFAWELDPCAAAQLSEPRVVCVNDSFDGTANGTSSDDSGEFVVFVPPYSGHYSFWVGGDASKSDANVLNCSWTLYSEADITSTELGDSSADGGFCGVEDVTTFRLDAGERYYLLPEVSRDGSTGTGYFTISAARNADGQETRAGAVALTDLSFSSYHQGWEGQVGTLIGTSTEAFYRFTASSAGTHTISVSGYPCGSGSGSVWVTLYEPGLSDPAFSNQVGSSSVADACSQEIQHSLQAGRDYFLKVENRLSGYNRSSFRPSPASIDIAIGIQN